MIVTLTMNPAIDKSSNVANVVAEKKLRCDVPVHEPGGGGLNVSRAINKLGGDSLALYPAGGPSGEMLDLLLEREGLRHRRLPINGWTRENLIVFETTSTLQYRFGMPGPELTEAEWRGCLDEVARLAPKPTYFVASGSLPRGVPVDFYGQLAHVLEPTGAKLIVDTSRDALRHALTHGVYLLKPNMNELAEIAGHSIEDEEDQERVAREVIARGLCEVLVLSLGAAGVLLVTRESAERMRAPSVPIKSKVGAGDSMVAGIVLGLDRGMTLRDAVRFGVAAGTAAVMTPGSELCHRDDTERLYQRISMEHG